MQALQYKVVLGRAVCNSGDGKCFVQALEYKEVLGSASCQLFSTK